MKKINLVITSLLWIIVSTQLAIASIEAKKFEFSIDNNGNQIIKVRDKNDTITNIFYKLPLGSSLQSIEFQYASDGITKTKTIMTYDADSQFKTVEYEYESDGITKMKQVQNYADDSQGIIFYKNGIRRREIDIQHDGITITHELDDNGNVQSIRRENKDGEQYIEFLDKDGITMKTSILLKADEDEVLY